jgi:hypothetical protein
VKQITSLTQDEPLQVSNSSDVSKYQPSVSEPKAASVFFNRLETAEIPPPPIVVAPPIEAETWNEQRVELWFNENRLREMYELVRPLDGRTLYQLFQLQTFVPDFFYRAITKNPLVDVKNVTVFSAALRDLFK